MHWFLLLVLSYSAGWAPLERAFAGVLKKLMPRARDGLIGSFAGATKSVLSIWMIAQGYFLLCDRFEWISVGEPGVLPWYLSVAFIVGQLFRKDKIGLREQTHVGAISGCLLSMTPLGTLIGGFGMFLAYFALHDAVRSILIGLLLVFSSHCVFYEFQGFHLSGVLFLLIVLVKYEDQLDKILRRTDSALN